MLRNKLFLNRKFRDFIERQPYSSLFFISKTYKSGQEQRSLVKLLEMYGDIEKNIRYKIFKLIETEEQKIFNIYYHKCNCTNEIRFIRI